MYWVGVAILVFTAISALRDQTRSRRGRNTLGWGRIGMLAATIPVFVFWRPAPTQLYNYLVMAYGSLILTAYIPWIAADAIDGRVDRFDKESKREE